MRCREACWLTCAWGCHPSLLPPSGSVAQAAKGIKDCLADFRGDVNVSCGPLANPALINVLVHGATKADGYLRSLGVELDSVSHCGGHSIARTHRFQGSEGHPPPPVGVGIMTILEKVARTKFAECAFPLPLVDVFVRACVCARVWLCERECPLWSLL